MDEVSYHVGHDVVLEDLASVGLSFARSWEDVKVCSALHAGSFSNHHTTTSVAIQLMGTTVGVSFNTSSSTYSHTHTRP